MWQRKQKLIPRAAAFKPLGVGARLDREAALLGAGMGAGVGAYGSAGELPDFEHPFSQIMRPNLDASLPDLDFLNDPIYQQGYFEYPPSCPVPLSRPVANAFVVDTRASSSSGSSSSGSNSSGSSSSRPFVAPAPRPPRRTTTSTTSTTGTTGTTQAGPSTEMLATILGRVADVLQNITTRGSQHDVGRPTDYKALLKTVQPLSSISGYRTWLRQLRHAGALGWYYRTTDLPPGTQWDPTFMVVSDSETPGQQQ